MIRRIWIRIFFLLAIAVVPATLLQLKLQKDSVGVVYNLVEGTGVRETLDQFLALIKAEAQRNPQLESTLREEFGRITAVKRSLESFFYARPTIDEHLRTQTSLIIVATLLISILGSLIISRGIVRHVQILMTERERAQAKLRDLDTLKNWQAIARMLVHELRAPMTPIKMISSDLDIKFRNLDHQSFETYLSSAQKLLGEQVQSIESMISAFTTFGRLPPPELQLSTLDDQVKSFCDQYSSAFGPDVKINFNRSQSNESAKIDPKLIRDLFFNLVKNAVEANQGKTQVSFTVSSDKDHVICLISNTGLPIANELSGKLFEPYVSSKAGNNDANMGLGLTICRKIALDHGGDLILLSNGTSGPVTFKLEIPLVPKG